MSASAVTVIIPVLNRPHRIIPVVMSIVMSAPDAKVLLVPNREGNGVRGMYEVLEDALELSDNVSWYSYMDWHPECGNYAKKINWAVSQWVDTDWIFTGADDLYFHSGWWEATDFLRSDPTIGVVGTNDLGHPRVYAMHETSTHSLVRVSYIEEHGLIDEPGKVLHEGYVHEFVDDELVGTAKYRGAWAFAPEAHIEHMHPIWNKAPWDATYDDQGRRMNESRALYAERCKLWGGVPI